MMSYSTVPARDTLATIQQLAAACDKQTQRESSIYGVPNTGTHSPPN